MHKVRLTKVSENNNALRTNVVEGECRVMPKEDGYFTIYGEGIEFGTRVVTTSQIKKVEEMENGYVFHTLNSVYKLEVLEETDNVES